MQSYTVANVMPTGQTSPKFGDEYYVKFAESEETFKVWRTAKNKPVEGAVWEGTIEGDKFKKAPFVSSHTESGATAKRTYGAIQADKGDGMRQGMCINNAANYVNATQGDKLEAEDWANMVHAFAQALYNKGNLTQTPEGVEVTDAVAGVQNVKDVFGIQ